MRWRWLFGNFADPEYDLPRAQERELSDRAHREHMPPRRFWIWTIFGIFLPFLLLIRFALPAVLGALGLTGRNLPYLVGLAVIVLLAWPLSAFVYGHLYVRAVRRAMAEDGVEVCEQCGQRLRGLPAEVDRCPECGGPRSAAPSPDESA